MARSRNVQQQNALVKDSILRVARWAIAKGSPVPWLAGVLREKGFDLRLGILARLEVVPEQEGNLFYGTWLTTTHQFWEFDIVVSRDTDAVLSIERFENVSSSTSTTAHNPGTGRSFGHIAIEVVDMLASDSAPQPAASDGG